MKDENKPKNQKTKNKRSFHMFIVFIVFFNLIGFYLFSSVMICFTRKKKNFVILSVLFIKKEKKDIIFFKLKKIRIDFILT
jgi:hypothetical protein